MSLDLKNIRLAASYLSKTELKFDLVSPVRASPASDVCAHYSQDAKAQVCLFGGPM
jgi:hypothetical protein